MRDFVEAGFDVSFEDPLIRAGREVMDLGHRVMSPAIRAKPVGAREKIRLENWLQYQFNAGLGHPVADRSNPQIADFAARFRDRTLPRRQRLETAVFQRSPQLAQKPLDSPHDLDVAGGLAVHSSRARARVAPHSIPRDEHKRGITDEVEQIIEPVMRIITSPLVQLGLDLQYPPLGPIQGRLARCVGIHPRPPGIPASSLLTCWPPSPCARLSRARTTTRPPPHPARSADDVPIPPARMASRPRGTVRDDSRVHCEPIDQRGIQLCPGNLAASTPQTFLAASPPASQTGYRVNQP